MSVEQAKRDISLEAFAKWMAFSKIEAENRKRDHGG